MCGWITICQQFGPESPEQIQDARLRTPPTSRVDFFSEASIGSGWGFDPLRSGIRGSGARTRQEVKLFACQELGGYRVGCSDKPCRWQMMAVWSNRTASSGVPVFHVAIESAVAAEPLTKTVTLGMQQLSPSLFKSESPLFLLQKEHTYSPRCYDIA